MVPVTMIASPARAPARLTMVPVGNEPSIAIEMVSGPEVRSVSPPSSGQPYFSASSLSPVAKEDSHDSEMSFHNASETRNPSGLAPLAARSDKFVRNALRASGPGGS